VSFDQGEITSMRKHHGFLRFLFVLILLAAGGAIWYAFLSEGQQKFIKNFIKQVPELPGRYSL